MPPNDPNTPSNIQQDPATQTPNTTQPPTPTPSPEPAEPPVPPAPSSTEEDVIDDWITSLEDDDEPDEPQPQDPELTGNESPTEPTPPEEPATPPETTPPETPPAPEEPPASTEPRESGNETPTEPPAPAQTPEEMQALRDKAVQELQERFKINEEDATALATEPETVLPKLAANLYLGLFDDVMGIIRQQMPGMIAQTIQQQKAVQDVEAEFYKTYPMLDPAQHKATVDRYAQAYSQVNPKATKEELFKAVAVQAMYALGINPEPPAAEPPPAPVPPPRTPPGVGSVPPPPAQPSDNYFEQLAEEEL